jgi:DNA-binding SARP family transcriptional activator
MNHPALDPSGAPLPTLALHLLGGFAVRVDGTALATDAWPSLRAAQLVQLLGLQARRRMARDQVVDALWPQLPAEAGAANLRKAAHHARHALGRHDAVVLQGGEVLLWPQGRASIDAEDFERLADAALAGRDAAACAEAARAYGGDLLPGSRYEAWTEAPRERLHARHFALLRSWSRRTNRRTGR